MNRIRKQKDGAFFYVVMALIMALLPVLGLAAMMENSSPVAAQGGQLYQPQSWDTIQGWSQNCQVSFPEGYRVPQRLVLTNNSLGSWSVPATDLVYDFYNSVFDSVGIDYHVSGSFKTASSSTSSSTLLTRDSSWWQTPGNGTAYTPSVLNQVYPSGTDCLPGDPADHHYSRVGPFTIPANTYLIIYWEAHIASTLQWQVNPPVCYDSHNGAGFFPGASLQTTIHNLGGLRSTQFPVDYPEGSICGNKYLDTAPLGTYNAGDTGLEDWIICLSGYMADGTPLTVCDNTSADGSYCFDYINDGTWIVSEQLQPGYVNSSPTSIELVISDGTAWAHVDFFNQVAEPLLTIEKLWTDLNAGSVKASDNICYTINYSNIGTAAADNVTITDNPDENWISSVYNISAPGSYDSDNITWLIDTLGIGESGSVSYCVQLSDNITFPPGQTNVTNTACIEPTDPDVCASVTIEVRNIYNLCIDKTWTDMNGLPTEPGDTICYNIGYCSPVPVQNVVITDDPDENWINSVFNISYPGIYNGDNITWNIGDFGPGTDNVTYCVTLKGPGSFPAGTTDVSNTACNDSDESELLCDTETVVVEAFPSLNLEKVWQDVNGGQTVPSDNICYTISYSNNGNAVADNVTITDTIDDTWIASVYDISDSGSYVGDNITWNIGTLGVGDSGWVYYCVTLNGIGSFPAGHTEVHNTACIEPTDPDLCRTRSVVVQAHPTFVVDKQADIDTAFPSDNVTFTILVCNNGNSGDSFVITDNPDENYINSVYNISDNGTYDGDIITWDMASLDPGECYPVSYDITLKESNSFPPGTTPVLNIACVDGTTEHGGGCGSVIVEVDNDIDLGITKRSTDVNGGTVEPGDTITYTLTYHNNGEIAVDNVTIEDDPDEDYIDSIFNISNGGVYDDDIITWHIGTVEAGGSGSVSYSAELKPSSSFPSGTTEVINTACIYPTDPVSCTTRTLEVITGQTIVTPPKRNFGYSGTTSNVCAPQFGRRCRIKDIYIEPQQAYLGQPIKISTQVVNEGINNETYELALKLNGHVEQTRGLNISPGTVYPVSFTVNVNKPGSYIVSIEDQYSQFTVVKPGAQDANARGIVIIAIAGLFAILIMLLALAWKRHQEI